jgi:uncharacterized membrane protein YdjX (TVP38/TMEM64 family)
VMRSARRSAPIRSALLRAAVFVGLLVALGVLALLVDLPGLADLKARIVSLGSLAPTAFVLIYAVTVLLPVPKSVLSAAAGLAFGVPLGISLVLIAATTGAVGAFVVARLLGRDAVARIGQGRLDRLDALLERHGMLTALLVRLIPVMPFTPLNYACGVTAMRLPHYALGTLIGLVPGTCLLVVVGSQGARLSPWALVGASTGLALLATLSGYVRYRRGRTSSRAVES